jgi:hypothetical protein
MNKETLLYLAVGILIGKFVLAGTRGSDCGCNGKAKKSPV